MTEPARKLPVAGKQVGAPPAKPNEPPPEGPDLKLYKSTMGEYGMKLPVGVLQPDGSLSKDFVIRAWKTRHERELGELKKPDMTMDQYVATVVGYMCTRIGPYEFTDKTEVAERVLRVEQMYLGDVFYIYCFLRNKAIDRYIPLKVGCPTCQRPIPYRGDLDSLEVTYVQSVAALAWEYPLRDPIDIRGKKVAKFKMSAPKWSMLKGATAAQASNDAMAKIAAARGCIVALNEEQDITQLTDMELDEMSKYDLEKIAMLVDDKHVGANMAIEGTCSKDICPLGGGYEFRQSIDWRYDSFFGFSSP